MIYKLEPIIRNNTEIKSVTRFNDDGSISCIPVDVQNADYQEYLKWLEEGNTPLPADEENN
jgi:hypothetical protein